MAGRDCTTFVAKAGYILFVFAVMNVSLFVEKKILGNNPKTVEPEKKKNNNNNLYASKCNFSQLKNREKMPKKNTKKETPNFVKICSEAGL